MNCPYCGNKEHRVVDKREANEATRRRRECLRCQKRFTTYERVEPFDLVVVKKDGRREPFSREKLRSGMIKACEKRPIPQEKIDIAADEIEAELRNEEKKELSSTHVGELVMRKLKKLDKVAYIRFASVYREFADLESFEKELKKLIKK
ncbi:transcriptional repressor NrdR [Candidatus Woesearchaeota archaeon]|nr:transcriptional repressor NrdR [Candidatus Woesearchaeota archaeon]